MESWPRVALNAPVGSLVGKKVAVGGLGPDGTSTVVYAQLLRRPFGVKVAITDTIKRSSVAGAASPTVEPGMTLGEVILAHADVRPWTAAEVPGLKWKFGTHPQWNFVWVLLIVAALVMAVVSRQFVFAQWTFPLIAGFVGLKLQGRKKRDRKAVGQADVVDGGRKIPPAEVFAMLPPSAVDPEAETLTPTDRVTLVREAYGKLRTDIAYRIENSALFDGAAPATQRFEIALIAWDPESPDAADLATEVEESFDAAREAAEAEGFAHLPDTARDTARRAHGATTMAMAATNPAERLAAATKAADLLRSLALYYLPSVDPAAPQLLAAPKEIEPAP